MEVLTQMNFGGHLIDVYGTEDEPLFLAVDIARIIDYSVGHTSHMLNCVDPDEKVLVNTSYNVRGNPNKWFLTEDGLYEVLFQSRKPIARRFKTAVKEILKDLRRSGTGNIEDWANHPDPYVDEWEQYNRENDEEIDFDEFLRTKGYTDDMLNDE